MWSDDLIDGGSWDEPADPAADPVEPVRVVVADGHALYRRALLMSLEEEGAEVLAEAGDADEAAAAAIDLAPDVVLLDAAIPGGEAIDVVARVAAAVPGTRVLLLVPSCDDPVVPTAVVWGAHGALVKETSVGAAPTAVRRAAVGEVVLPCATAAELAAHPVVVASPDAREAAALRALGAGADAASVALALRTTERRVGRLAANAVERLHRSTCLPAAS